ncbi:MAG: DUF4168 domain-containing protein [Desulfobacterales bacterium]
MNAKTLLKKTTAWKTVCTGLIIAACFLIAAPPLAAQQSQQGQQGYGGEQEQQQQQQQQEYQYEEPEQKSASDFEEDTLQKFAEAKTDVDDIRGEYSEELRGVEDADKARELQDKYTEKMIDAIEGKDLSVNKYNEVSQAMQNSPELQEKVNSMMD